MATILTFCDYFAPGYKGGGPITTLVNAATSLRPHHELKIVTRDRDLGDTAAYPGIDTGAWSTIGGIDVLYLSPEQQTLANVVALLRREKFDILYLNSFHSLPFTLLPLIARRLVAQRLPTVLAPRGEFAPAALALKRWRKRLFRKSIQALGTLSGITFQASSLAEATDINAALGPSTRIFIAPDMSAPVGSPPGYRTPKQVNAASLVFIGRISRMKNIDWLIREVNKVEQNIQLLIYGPIEDSAYWRECEAALAESGAPDRILYCGPLEPTRVRSVLSKADALILPSLGENFAQVVAEALAAGCPAIVSDRTPWKLLEASGAGWCLPLEEPERWQIVMSNLVEMSEETHASFRTAARQMAGHVAENSNVAAANKELFDSVLN